MRILVLGDRLPDGALISERLKRIGHYDVHFIHDYDCSRGMPVDVNGLPRFDVILIAPLHVESKGIEIAEAIRADHQYRNVPLLLFCGADDGDTMARLAALEDVDCIGYPVHLPELKIRMRQTVRLINEIEKRQSLEQRLRETRAEMNRLLDIVTQNGTIDPETGLATREHFQEILKKEWRRSYRDGGSLSLFLIGIDSFEEYKQIEGAEKSRQCLRQVAAAVRETLKRAGDTIASIEVGELAAILPETDALGATIIGEIVRTAVADLRLPHPASDNNIVTISIGIATVKEEEVSDIDELIRLGSQALTACVRDGGNRVTDSARLSR